MDNRTPVPPEFRQAPDGATEPQIKYIEGLLDQKNLLASPKFFDAVNAMDQGEFAAYIENLKSQARTLTKKTASKWIAALKALPNKPLAERTIQRDPARPPVDVMKGRTYVVYEKIQTDEGEREIGKVVTPNGEVLIGSYGIDTSKDSRFANDTSFFKVWINEDFGKGWGVKMYVSDDTSRVSIAVPTQVDVIKIIAQDPLAASKLFGQEFGRCGVCGRGLTNDESRALGIGPVCGARLGIR
jgi:Family of unknown function (DUF6011)